MGILIKTIETIVALAIFGFLGFLAFVIIKYVFKGLIYVLNKILFHPIKRSILFNSQEGKVFFSCAQATYKFFQTISNKKNINVSVSHKIYYGLSNEKARLVFKICIKASSLPDNCYRITNGRRYFDLFSNEYHRGYSLSDEEDKKIFLKYDEQISRLMFDLPANEFEKLFIRLHNISCFSQYKERNGENFLPWDGSSLYYYVSMSDVLENGDVEVTFPVMFPEKFTYIKTYAKETDGKRYAIIGGKKTKIKGIDEKLIKKYIKKIQEV